MAIVLKRPLASYFGFVVIFLASLLIYPLLGVAFFPRTEAGQFLINLKSPSGTRLNVTENEVTQVEQIVRKSVDKEDLGVIVSNIGVTPGFSSIYTSNSAPHTAFVQVSLTEGHRTGSYEYMKRVRGRIASRNCPNLVPTSSRGAWSMRC